VNVAGAAGFGLAFCSCSSRWTWPARPARGCRGAVIGSHLGRWSGFGAATLLRLPRGGAGERSRDAHAIRYRPLLAAGGALGVMTTIAVIFTRVTSSRRSAGR